MSTGQSSSEAGAETEGAGGSEVPTAGFARLPRWARLASLIGIVALVAAIIGIVIAVAAMNASGTSTSDPEAAAQAACEPAAEAQLEQRGHSDIDVSEQATVTLQADGGYRVQGTVTFVEDGNTHHADVRCIVRIDEGGAVEVVSVRFND